MLLPASFINDEASHDTKSEPDRWRVNGLNYIHLLFNPGGIQTNLHNENIVLGARLALAHRFGKSSVKPVRRKHPFKPKKKSWCAISCWMFLITSFNFWSPFSIRAEECWRLTNSVFEMLLLSSVRLTFLTLHPKPLTPQTCTRAHTHTHSVDIKMCQHAIRERSCYLLSVLITAITGNSGDKSLCCVLLTSLLLSPGLTQHSRKVLPGSAKSSVLSAFVGCWHGGGLL